MVRTHRGRLRPAAVLAYSRRPTHLRKVNPMTRAGLRVLVLTAALGAVPAAAAQLMGPALHAGIAGAEFRGYTYTGRGFENHIWRFAPDGRVTAVYNVRFDVSKFPHQYDGAGFGTWAVEGDRVCIRWEPGMRLPGGCYAIDQRQGSQVRLIGPEVWDGTLQR
jgi:hypothetical protein